MGARVRQLIAEEAAVAEQTGAVRPLRAIQAEALELRPGNGRITDEDKIASFVESVPDEYIPCREGGRHYYPIVDPSQMIFKPTADGLDRFEVTCTECGMAYRFEDWLIRERDGRVVVMRLINKGMDYHRPKADEPDYLAPKGTGYVAPTDFRQARVAAAFMNKKTKVKRVGARRPTTD